MLSISGIDNGYVIDHIKAGKSMDIYEYLKLGKLDCQVAIIKNATSNKMEKKDIIKIQGELDLDLDILGFIDNNITINCIKGGKIVKKKNLTLPNLVTNVVSCRNPRCITSIEQGLTHIFKLTDSSSKTYRCVYCEEKLNQK